MSAITGSSTRSTPWIRTSPAKMLEACAASLLRIAAIPPRVTLVLGAPTIHVAAQDVLAGLVTAFQTVRAGKDSATPASAGRVIYKVDHIYFLMRSPEFKH